MNESSDQPKPPMARPISAAPMVQLVTGQAGPVGSASVTPGNPLVITQSRPTILLDLLIACVGFFLALLSLEFLCALLFTAGPEGTPSSGWVLVGQRAVLSVLTALILLMLLRKNGQPAASIGVRSDGLARSVFFEVAAFLTIFGYVLAVSFAMALFWPGAIEAMEQVRRQNMQRVPDMGLGVAVVFSLMVAVSEELLFRGFIVTRLRGLTGSWTAAVLISSAVFALLHVPQGWLPVALIFGISLLLGLWLVWRANLVVPIVAHALFDTASLLLMKHIPF